ncbi:uncharacterized protein BO95DRAFT_427371 [Aspergillus brunneoviolaceus CBS 621.78]|uniref:Uncharacterized protein n=1 Tax=Aspergillus brunneoviolaceus CBS 621.78 TaxID=1450534 RepID=A0ACD1GMS8_9EURO|nr:hypothetical protein BO95DRAFT_427371 [Aspergillus brunneoviolaceus CBS 621.78]RAH50437.1 hypothetical protein BO95DRAFT_427371 [Aspergillus brunneoviolaceus CBS 621.78]
MITLQTYNVYRRPREFARMDTFDRVPRESLVEIVKTAADWVTLEDLIVDLTQLTPLFEPGNKPDSPADPEAMALVRHILEHNSTMSYDYLERYFMVCVELRGPIPHTSLYDFVDKTSFDLQSSKHGHRLSMSTATRASLRAVVNIAANIQRLACMCLTTLRARLQAILPQYFKDIREMPSLVPRKLRDVGAFSWIEEYRVYRALWHFQAFSDFLQVAVQLRWTDKRVLSLQRDHLHWSGLCRQEPYTAEDDTEWETLCKNTAAWEEICEVSECLESLYAGSPDLCTTYSPQAPSEDEDKFVPECFDLDRKYRIHANHKVFLLERLPNAFRCPAGPFEVWSPPAQPREGDLLHELWGQSGEHTAHHEVLDFVYAWRLLQEDGDPAACYNIATGSFRALGMGLWDHRRLFELGLHEVWPDRGSTALTTPDGDVRIWAHPRPVNLFLSDRAHKWHLLLGAWEALFPAPVEVVEV